MARAVEQVGWRYPPFIMDIHQVSEWTHLGCILVARACSCSIIDLKLTHDLKLIYDEVWEMKISVKGFIVESVNDAEIKAAKNMF